MKTISLRDDIVAREPVSTAAALAVYTGLYNAGVTAAVAYGATVTLVAAGTIAINAAISIGATFAFNALTKRNPDLPQDGIKPQDGQQTVRQSTAARRRHYGKVKVGGIVAFYEVDDKVLYVVVILGEGEIASFEEHWLTDLVVELDGNDVDYDQFITTGGERKVSIYPLTGTASQSAHSELVSTFSGDWTTDHRLLGIANALLIFRDVGPEEFPIMYPNGAPSYRAVIKGAKVYDPRDGGHSASNPSTWTWSDNPALCILDYLTHPDGMNRPRSMFSEASFTSAANDCDDAIPLKAGGTEKRYRLSGTYELTEKPADVLRRMLAVCDGELYQLSDGTWGLRVGKWAEPTVSIAADHILSYSIEQGADALASFNVLKTIYVSPFHDYQETECDPWVDEESIAAIGEEVSEELRLIMCPSPSQARRLAKINTRKLNPEWRGTVRTSLAGLAALGERFVNIELPELEINQAFRVTAFNLAADLSYCELSVVSASSDDYAWNAATEEGDAPPPL